MSATSGTISKPPGAVPQAPKEGANNPPGRRDPRIARWVFWPAAAIIIGFVLFTTIFPSTATALFGEIQLRGRLPVTMGDLYPRGHGLSV